jgi:hypothetical protein
MHNLDYELILILKIKRLRERALGKKIVMYYKSSLLSYFKIVENVSTLLNF